MNGKQKGSEQLINLKKIREERGLTQQELADICGVVRQTITEIERGVNRPSVPLAKKIGRVLDLEWSKFFED